LTASTVERKAQEDLTMYTKLIDDLSGQVASLEQEGQEVRERWAQAVAEAGRREAERGGVEKERDEVRVSLSFSVNFFQNIDKQKKKRKTKKK
jgi:chromosome segregation ATPase